MFWVKKWTSLKREIRVLCCIRVFYFTYYMVSGYSSFYSARTFVWILVSLLYFPCSCPLPIFFFLFFLRFNFFVLSWLLFLGSTVWFKIAYKFCYTVSNIYIYIYVLSFEAGEETMRYTVRGLWILNQGPSLTFGGHLPLCTNII